MNNGAVPSESLAAGEPSSLGAGFFARLSSSSPYIVNIIIETARKVNDFAAARKNFYPKISPFKYASGISPTTTLSQMSTCVGTEISSVRDGMTTLTVAVTSI